MIRISGNQSFAVCKNTVGLRCFGGANRILKSMIFTHSFWRTKRLLTLTMLAALSLFVCDPRGALLASTDGKVNMIDDVLFWKVIDSTIALESSPKRQLEALHAALSRLSLEQLERYEASFDSEMRRSYSWDLWGAAYVIRGGASDDSFEYFRCWLISKGKRVFEKVLADPDSLADVLAPDVEGILEFESFAYVARKTWGEKTGKPGTEMPNAAPMLYTDQQPTGIQFDESPASLAKHYPKLWKRFGSSPLG
jgi:hypothetical protein